MCDKMVENSSDICDAVESETKERGLLLLTVREGPSAVLPLFLRRLSEDGKVVNIGLEQHVGFRKIEPKPVDEDKEDGCDVQSGSNGGDTRSPSLLESKSTRRGVRICPSCQGRVGYRSKVCKHCSMSSGISSRSPTNVRRKRTRQRKQKVNTKRNTRSASEETRDVEKNAEECHSAVPIDILDVQIRGRKSDEALLYDSNQFSATRSTTLASESEGQMPARLNGSHGNILYETQTRAGVNERDENNFDKDQSEVVEEREVHCLEEVNKRCDYDASENPDHERFATCRKNSDSNLSDMTSVQLVQGRNVDEIVIGNTDGLTDGNNLRNDVRHYISDSLHNNTKNIATHMEDLTSNLADNEGNIANDATVLANVDSSKENGDNLETIAENIRPCIADEEDGEEISANTSVVSGVVPESSSPVLLVDLNSIGSISVTTSDDNSQSVGKKEYSISIESPNSENTFVFESADTNSTTAVRSEDVGGGPVGVFGDSDIGSEKHENMKRSKKRKTGQEPHHHRRKQSKVSIVQFVRIEPKPVLEIDENSSSREQEQGILKQNRILSSNPTRRGVMLCPLCQKDVGCRSRTCKYCKVAINLCPTKLPLDQKNLLAVELCEETCPHHTIYSVKKSLSASEERCFVKKVKTTCTEEELPRDEPAISDVFSCDCIEDTPIENSSCEHTLSMHRSPKITQARRMALKPAKIDSLPIDFIFKLKLGELWEKIKESEFPFVQQVCQNTLVVSDVDSNGQTTQNSVHVRFEKLRRRSNTELHIFCSGKTCSSWNDVEEEGKDVPVTCLHYCVSLWAIASDNDLQKYFKIFLDATQVYLHSEVFESILKE